MADSGRPGWNVPVFVAGARTMQVGHVVVAADCRGELLAVWNTFAALLETEKRGAALVERDEADVDDEQLQSLSEQFRYDRDLITAEDTERWLEERGLTLEDFNGYFVRHYWAATLDPAPAQAVPDYRTAGDSLWDLLIVELQLSGELDRMAQRLAWRLAADTARGSASDVSGAGSRDAVAKDAAGDGWLKRLGCNRQWIAEVLRLEAEYQRSCEQLLTPDVLERSLASMRLALMRIDLETVDVDSLDAVRELAMCVREDGRSMAEVASDGRYPYERTEAVLEDLPAEVQQKVLFAAPGDVLAPLSHEGGFFVHRLIARSEPDLADDDIRERVERQVLARHFSSLAADSIRWLLAPADTP